MTARLMQRQHDGPHLLRQCDGLCGQVDMAINHYIEAGQYVKAVEAAISSRQWAKAVEFVDKLEPKISLPLYKRIAVHYEETSQYAEAERFYLKAHCPQVR